MRYLRIVNDQSDTFTSLMTDDPIRPEISLGDRFNSTAEMLVLMDEQDEPVAVVCIRYCSEVPESVPQMLSDPGGTIAVLYTIWSYRPGGGSSLVAATLQHVKKHGASQLMTLSPLTDMAQRFHSKNGAVLVRQNHSTVNFEYQLGS